MRIAIDGTQSSGKTTLLTGLTRISELNHYNFISEIGSKLAKSRFGVRCQNDWRKLYENAEKYSNFVHDVYVAQLAAEHDSDDFIIDSSLYRLEAYRRYCNVATKAFHLECKYDLILYCESLDYAEDGFRTAFGREGIEVILKRLIAEFHQGKLITIRGDPRVRLSLATEILLRC